MIKPSAQPCELRELRVGNRVELHGLVVRPDLNGNLCTIVKLDKDVGRWQLKVDGSTEVVRARSINLRRDRIEVVPREGAAYCVMRPAWRNSQDADESAHHILVEHILAQRTKTFNGSIIVHTHEQLPRDFKPSPVTVLPSSTELWNADELMSAVKAALPNSVDVKEAHLLWNNPSEREFSFSMTEMILRAHTTTSTVYIAIRTIDNMRRFAMLQTLSSESPDNIVSRALLGGGTIICTPTEAIAFHKDNMIKLPTTLSLSQAVRKLVDMVQNGIETPCLICLELPSSADPTVFMPCGDCKVAIHISCMQLLYDNKVTVCPNCRSPLGPLEMR
jgi:hypothetical protein